MITASISGRAAFDPRVIQTKSGKAMATIRLACADDAGDSTLWIDLLCFGWNAEWLARAAKGDRIAAMGSMKMNTWTNQRTGIQGHLWITLLAYHLVHYIRLNLKANDIHDSWSTLRKRMATQVRITTTMHTKSGNTFHIRKASRPEAYQAVIYKTLGLSPQPGGITKTIIADLR